MAPLQHGTSAYVRKSLIAHLDIQSLSTLTLNYSRPPRTAAVILYAFSVSCFNFVILECPQRWGSLV